jgi:small conductance mechanosensitive channel
MPQNSNISGDSISAIDNIATLAYDKIMDYGPKLLLALVVLFIGLRIIKSITKMSNKRFEKTNLDPTLRPFLLSLISVLLKAMLFIAVASMIGVETTSFVAVLGAAGLAVGLALQGTLANFAGGVLLLIFKPYKVGDLIETQGHLGSVKEIQIFNSILLSPENKTIIIPNGAISNGDITNYSKEGMIRVDIIIGISYNADIKKAKDVLNEIMASDSRVLKDPAPTVAVSELADSSVNMVVRPWCNPADYWDVLFDTTENCKLALDEANIEIPFPQLDVHLSKD